MNNNRLRAGFAWAFSGLESAPAARSPAGDDALLDVMLVAACADGEIFDSEMTALARGLAGLKLGDLSDPIALEQKLLAIAGRIIAEGPDGRLASAAGALTHPAAKLAALRLAAVVIFSDEAVQDEEPPVLLALAEALGLDASTLADAISAAGEAMG